MFSITLCILTVVCFGCYFEGITPLMKASKRGDVAEVDRLIKKGVNLNAKDWYGDSALYWAARCNHADIAKLLIDNGANVNERFQRGHTPLMIASLWESSEIVKYLLEKGADPNAVNDDGECPIGYPAFADFEEIVNLLLKFGADPNKCNPIISSSRQGNNRIVKLLISKGADINLRNEAGETALIAAVQNCRVETVKILLQSGANNKIKDSHGKTPFHLSLSLVQNLMTVIDEREKSSPCSPLTLEDCKQTLNLLENRK